MPRPPLVLETWGRIRRGTKGGVPFAVANYRDSDGVTRKMMRTGRTEAQAEQNLVRAMKERLAPAGEELTRDSRVADLARTWLAETEERDLADGTIVKYREAIENHIVKGIGDVRLREASVPKLDRFVKTLTKNSGPATARIVRVVLSGMFALATRHGAVASNPIRDVASVPRKKRLVVAPLPSDIPEIRAILAAWDSGRDKRGARRTTDLADVADMFIATGCRTGEVFALTWNDLDLASDPATVHVHSTIALNRDAKLTVQSKPKSDTSIRVLMLPPSATQMLTRRRVESGSEWVFPSSTGTFRSPNNFRTQWRAALAGTRFAGVTPKSFRKAVATAIRDALGVGAAKDQLGHSSEAITNAHYVMPAGKGPDARVLLDRMLTS